GERSAGPSAGTLPGGRRRCDAADGRQQGSVSVTAPPRLVPPLVEQAHVGAPPLHGAFVEGRLPLEGGARLRQQRQHEALRAACGPRTIADAALVDAASATARGRSEEHTSELQ